MILPARKLIPIPSFDFSPEDLKAFIDAAPAPPPPLTYESVKALALSCPKRGLCEAKRAVWEAFNQGAVTVEQVDELTRLIDVRRATPRPMPRPQIHREPTERQKRRRRWMAPRWLLPEDAQFFTPGESAALSVIAQQIGTKKRPCDLSIGQIASLAGVKDTTVQNALRLAKARGMIVVTYRRLSYDRNLTNIIRISSKKWCKWLHLRTDGGAFREWDGSCTSLYIESGRHDNSQHGDLIEVAEAVKEDNQKGDGDASLPLVA